MFLCDELHAEKLRAASDYVKSKGHYPIFISIHGSQNYQLDLYTNEYQSDFDYECVILPRLEELVKQTKPVSTVYDYQGGHIGVKDIRFFASDLVKANPTYLECLATPHRMTCDKGCQQIEEMADLLDDLVTEAGSQFVMACQGMFRERIRKMLNVSPATQKNIESYGYDGKSASHLYRMTVMLRTFITTGKMQLIPSDQDKAIMMQLKLHKYPLDEVLNMSLAWENEVEQMVWHYKETEPNPCYNVRNKIRSLSCDAVYIFCCSSEGRKKSD